MSQPRLVGWPPVRGSSRDAWACPPRSPPVVGRSRGQGTLPGRSPSAHMEGPLPERANVASLWKHPCAGVRALWGYPGGAVGHRRAYPAQPQTAYRCRLAVAFGGLGCWCLCRLARRLGMPGSGSQVAPWNKNSTAKNPRRRHRLQTCCLASLPPGLVWYQRSPAGQYLCGHFC